MRLALRMTKRADDQSKPIRQQATWSALGWSLAALFILLLGLGIRLLDMDDPPLEFHSTRQLRAAIIARGMYYANLPGADPAIREEAVRIWSTMEQYEPPILERIVASAYRVMGGENLWVARLLSSLFWTIGGAALYAMLRRLVSPGAALFSLSFYMILPWGISASRSFQPDPFMVMWILLASYAFLRWVESHARSWAWTAAAGLFAGMAILVKVYAGYPVAAAAIALLLSLIFEEEKPVRALRDLALRPQVWVCAALSLGLPAIYYLGLGSTSSSFASFWILSFTGLLADRKFYIHWLGLVRGLMDVMVFFAAMLGVFLFPRRGRWLSAGLWAGYLLIGLTFPYQITTHDYYSIVLIPVAAVGLAPFADVVLERLSRQPRLWRAGFAIVFLGIFGYYAWVARSQVYAADYRSEPIPWTKMGQELPQDGAIIALTHDYGNRLKYYGWRVVNRLWPIQAEINLSAAAGSDRIGDFAPYFLQQTEGMDYFLVTLFADLEAQPDLKAELYDHYPVAMQGDGYILFDLRSRRETP